MGSKQYLDEAEKRILKCCEAGAVFLMFDGTWWNGPCVDERHGHPIPYRYEDHIRTCVELARRIHAKYPKVLIEMHDMLAGGEWRRMTPVYYKYGLPGSYDENWGFELMWSPMKNLKEGTSDALYYYASDAMSRCTCTSVWTTTTSTLYRCGGMPRPAGTWASARSAKSGRRQIASRGDEAVPPMGRVLQAR